MTTEEQNVLLEVENAVLRTEIDALEHLAVENQLLRNVVDALCREATAGLNLRTRFGLRAFAHAGKQGKHRLQNGFLAAADQLAAARRDLEQALAAWAAYSTKDAA